MLNVTAFYHIFMISAQNTPYFTWARHYNMRNTPTMNIKFNVNDITKPNAVPAINDFLFPQFANAHRITLNHLISCFIICTGQDNVACFLIVKEIAPCQGNFLLLCHIRKEDKKTWILILPLHPCFQS